MIFATSKNLTSNRETSLQFVSSKCSSFQLRALNFALKSMKNTSNQEITCVQIICKFCKQNFHFNNELYEHIRNHETLKLVNDFHFSINAINLVCEIEKTSFVSHKFSVSFAKFQKFEYEFAITFKTIILLKRSSLSFFALETKSKSTKRSTTCRRCNRIFNFNNKFHEHIRQHHARKFVKNFDFRVFALEFEYKFSKKSIIICSFVSFVSSIFFATSRSQIFSTKIVSQFLASRCSNLSIATYKIDSKSMKNAIVVCSFIFSFISSFDSVRKHQKSHIQKFYLIVNDLSRMFVEKSKSFDLQQHQNRCRFSQNFDFRQFDRFSIFSKKFYLIMQNLFEMFNEKFKRKNLFQNQNNVFFQTFSNQMQIIVYFQSTINQKSSIIQNSKNSKSKSLNQHMFAKWIRIVFSKNLFEKSINLSYKSTNVFCVKNKSLQILDFSKSKHSKSRISAEIFFFIFIFFRFFSIFLFAFAIVSIVSIATKSCINVYEQIISIIDRVIQ